MEIRRKECSDDVRVLIDEVRSGKAGLLEDLSLKPKPEETLSAAKTIIMIVNWLKDDFRFTFARRILELARKHLKDIDAAEAVKEQIQNKLGFPYFTRTWMDLSSWLPSET